jgi:hypothetical protein
MSDNDISFHDGTTSMPDDATESSYGWSEDKAEDGLGLGNAPGVNNTSSIAFGDANSQGQ